jgi:KaiC/GvpD/RAD55 family RecA-like ATPase
MGEVNQTCYFDPQVEGLSALLLQAKDAPEAGFVYHSASELNIVICGPPGVGKTILAMQIATAAAAAKPPANTRPWKVVYLTKDIPPRVLFKRMGAFEFFQRQMMRVANENSCNPAIHPWVQNGEPNIDFCFLEELLPPTSEERAINTFVSNWTSKEQGLLAIARFSEAPVGASRMDRYAIAKSVYEAIGYIQPELRPVFELLKDSPPAGDTIATVEREQILVVCDSLSPRTLEYHLKAQHHFSKLSPDSKPQPNLIFLFVLDSASVPESMAATFPPDVKIILNIRNEAHGVNTRSIRLAKTRFQKSLDEETPFVILAAQDQASAAVQQVIVFESNGVAIRPAAEIKNAPQPYASRRPGIEIMPPIAHEPFLLKTETVSASSQATHNNAPERVVQFGLPDLDSFTKERHLAGGGCTLLATQNRCGSTALSLHYLLSQVATKVNPTAERDKPSNRQKSAYAPSGVLYISFSGEVTEILHTVWRHAKLRSAIWNPDAATDESQIKATWKSLESQLSRHQSANDPAGGSAHPRHRLYIIPIRRLKNEYFYVYIPDFTWVTAEEAMDRITRLLHPHGQDQKVRVQRVVLDRVSRLPARWPLIQNHDVFISGIVSHCAKSGVELMLIDDTEHGNETTGLFHSQWVGVAQNIIRLRRVPFHGVETRSIELIKASGRIVNCKRPHEVVFHHGATDYDDAIGIEDNFRGYTGLSIGRPERSKVEVDLSYDEEHTALYRDVMATKAKIEATVDEVTVTPLGPGKWSGINSAFNNLSSVSRDKCRIVAIDGIWLGALLKSGILHCLSDNELLNILPEHIRDGINQQRPGRNGQPESEEAAENQAAGADKRVPVNNQMLDIDTLLDSYYVTKSLTTAITAIQQDKEDCQKAEDPVRSEELDNLLKRLGRGFKYALPMRHNWGLLAITKPATQFVRQVFIEVAEWLQNANSNNEDSGTEESFGGDLRIWNVQLGKALAFYLDKLSRTDDKKANNKKKISEELIKAAPKFPQAAEVIISLLCGFELPWSDKPSLKLAKKIWLKLWKQPELEISYAEIVDYRIQFWQPFWRDGWFERTLTKIAAGRKAMQANLWVSLFPRIDLFGLAMVSPESVVSFFLELLLAHVPEKDLFNPTSQHLLYFKHSLAARQGFQLTLSLFFRLLSPNQRRRIALGIHSEQGGDGFHLHNRLVASSQYHESFREWPSQFSLFSREWITTVQDLLPQYDVRKQVELSTLPIGKPAVCEAYWQHLKQKNRCGPTVAGTWYLGVLRGGNTDLAKDIMKQILSGDHELERALNLSDGPVSALHYEQNSSPTWRLPYADTMRRLYGHTIPRSSKRSKPDDHSFPFYRTRIINYLEASDILYELVRQIMRLESPEDDLALNGNINWDAWSGQTQTLIEHSLSMLNQAQTGARKPN